MMHSAWPQAGRGAGRWAWRMGAMMLMLMLMGLPALAQPKGYELAPPPDWVLPLTADWAAPPPAEQVAQGVFHLLTDHQVRIDGRERTSYRQLASKAINERGVERVANIEIRFDPAYQRLSLHAINIHRGGRKLAKLDSAVVRVLQRERELEALVFDGSKTAHVFLEDVRVGDVVEYAYSLRGHNPVFGERQFGRFDLQWNEPVARAHARLLWPANRALHWRRLNGAPEPAVHEGGTHRDFRWDRRDIALRIVESDAPGWFDPYPSVHWGEFEDWQAVVRWAQPLYRSAASPGAQVQAEAARIAARHADPAERLLAALRFVQSEVRYLGIEIGAGSHAPSPPEVVLRRRFGDCKDKTMLTIALLRALGIEARPALVNTAQRRGIRDWLPSPGAFNHVLVQARLGQDTYWLDPTRSPQAGRLDKVVQADFEAALVIDEASHELVPMAPNYLLTQWREVHALIDASAGFDRPVSYTVTTEVEGAAADSLRHALASQSREALQKRYLNYYAAYYPGTEAAGPLEVEDDPVVNRLKTVERYTIQNFWPTADKGATREAAIAVPELMDLLRAPGTPLRGAPLALNHPVDLVHVTEVRLPEAGSGTNDELKVSDPAFDFQRVETWKQGKTLVLTDRFRSLRDHVDAADVARYSAALEKTRQGLHYALYRQSPAATGSAQGGGSPHWLAAVTVLLGLLGFGAVALRLQRWDPAPIAPPPLVFGPAPLRGLGGWLLVLGLAMLMMIWRAARTLVESWPAFTVDGWHGLTAPGSENYHPLWAASLLFSLLLLLAQLVGLLLALWLFMRKRSSLPPVLIGVFVGVAVLALIEHLLLMMIPPAGITAKEHGEMFRGLMGSALWTAYLLRSRRVRETFVERLGPRDTTALPTVAAAPQA